MSSSLLANKEKTNDIFVINVISLLAWKNIKLRYKNSALGFFWSVLNPLIFLLIFVFIFSQAFLEVKNYPLFALTGIIYWNFFSTTSSQILSSVLEGSGILKSIAIPSLVFPIATLYASLVNLALSFIPFIFLIIFFGGSLNRSTIWIIPYTILFSVFILGFSLILAALNIYFRDIGMLWSTLLPAILYLTPIAYPATLIPENSRWLMQFNPLFHYINAVREILYEGHIPSKDVALIALSLSAFSITIGLLVFKKLERNFISAF